MRLALALLLLLIARPALAGGEPDGVLGVPWDATQADLRSALQQGSDTVRCDSPEICRIMRARLGAVPVSVTYFFPKDGKFEMAILTFDTADYEKMVALFVDRYGDPGSARQDQVQLSGCSAAITNTFLEWTGKRVVMDLRKFESKSEGRATIMLKALRDREAAAASTPENK